MDFNPKSLYQGDGSDLRAPDGVFWADHIKTLKERPAARLLFAEQHQPLPAAFREAGIALRALIRERRRDGEEYDELLEYLYETAARHAFLYAQDRILERYPAYNAVAQLERDEWTELQFSYDRFGYDHLPLLNKTDRKWMVDSWGEPTTHRAPQDVYREVFQRGVERFQQDQEESDAQFRAMLRDEYGSPERFQASLKEDGQASKASSQTGCLGLIVATLILGGLATLIWGT